MRDYELTVLIRPDVAEKELNKQVKSISDLLDLVGAKISKKDDAVKRPLAYKIAKVSEAFYTYWEFSMEPAKVAELENKLKLADYLVRYLLVKKG